MVFRKTHEESGSKTTRLKSCRKTYTVGGQYLLSFVSTVDHYLPKGTFCGVKQRNHKENKDFRNFRF